MLAVKDIAWAAGIVEGEGCLFTKSNNPAISVQMCDHDVMAKLAHTFDTNLNGPYQRAGRKAHWRLCLNGSKAASWMMTLYPLLGERRRGRIREALMAWRKPRTIGYWKGRSFSTEHKQKLSASLVGNTRTLGCKWTPEQREKLLSARTNRRQFAEAR